jgi:hypothetical protein
MSRRECRPHNCIDYVDLRFTGADDFEGHMECLICGVEYSAEELSAMHENRQERCIYDGIQSATGSLRLPRQYDAA